MSTQSKKSRPNRLVATRILFWKSLNCSYLVGVMSATEPKTTLPCYKGLSFNFDSY
jgi:hypothetical protein